MITYIKTQTKRFFSTHVEFAYFPFSLIHLAQKRQIR